LGLYLGQPFLQIGFGVVGVGVVGVVDVGVACLIIEL